MKFIPIIMLPVIAALKAQDCQPVDLKTYLVGKTWTASVSEISDKPLEYVFGENNMVQSANSVSAPWSFEKDIFSCAIIGRGSWSVYFCADSYIVMSEIIDGKTTGVTLSLRKKKG